MLFDFFGNSGNGGEEIHSVGTAVQTLQIVCQTVARAAVAEGDDGCILQKDGFDPTTPYTFDYTAACSTLSHVLDLRVLDFATQGAFCFIFAEVPEDRWDDELNPLLHSTLDEFIYR